MIIHISKFIATSLCTKKQGNPEYIDEIEILQYGIECILNTLIPSFLIFIIAFVLHQFIPTLLWFISFLLARYYLGGYHAPTHFRCILYSTITGILAIFFEITLSNDYIYYQIALLIVGLIFFLIKGPVLQDDSFHSQKKKMKVSTSCLFFIICIFMIVFQHSTYAISNAFFLGIATAYLYYIIAK